MELCVHVHIVSTGGLEERVVNQMTGVIQLQTLQKNRLSEMAGL